MQTLEALLEKKIPDDYLKNYKKTINSKLPSTHDIVRSESNGQNQSNQNGENCVTSQVNSPVSKAMPLTALSSNGVTANGNVKLISNMPLPADGGGSFLKKGGVQIRAINRVFSNQKRRLLPAINGVPAEEIFRLPGPSLTSDGRKKFKMSTVSKVVPLINTVGNQSKLLPLQVLPTEVGQNSVVSASPLLKSSLKPSSILEARLSTQQLSGPSLSDSVSAPKSTNVAETPVSLMLNDESSLTSEQGPSTQGYIVQKNRKTTISFERGATRIVSTKAKNTQTVDIGVQVYMPDPDDNLEGNTGSLPNSMPPLQPISSATSGPMHPAASVSTVPANELFILDTKNGRRIITIPKQMNGTKSLSIDGKNVSVSHQSISNGTRGILLSDLNSGQNRSNLVTAASLSCDTVTTPSSGGRLSISTPLQVPSSSSPVILSVATSIGATRSIQTIMGSNSLSFKRNIPSDGLVFPLNYPVSNAVTSSQPSFQTTASSSDSIVLPLNSPVKSSSISRLNGNNVCRIPNTTSLFILVPNDRNDPVNQVMEHEMDVSGLSSLNVQKRKAEGLRIGNMSLKKRCLEIPKSSSNVAEASVRRSVQQHTHELIQNSPNPAINNVPNEPSAPMSKEDMSSLVKNAFSEFKNCLHIDKDGKMPIHVAVENNDLAAAKRQCLVLKARRSSVDVFTSKDETPLQLALYSGYSSMAALLLQHGADASIVDQEGNTALHLAVKFAEDVFESASLPGQCTEKLVNTLNDDGFSALHLAAQHDKVTAIEWLMKHGAEVDLADEKSGRTALFLAIERKCYRAQKALLSYGADMKEPTFSGSTPFHLTKADTIAHLTSGQDTVAEFIDSDVLLRSSSPSEDN